MLFLTDSAEPYNFLWDTTEYADGAYYLVARAYDSSGNIGQSNEITVYVNNSYANKSGDTISPTVSITSPLDGSTVKKIVTIQVTASDNAGVSKIELYIDGALKAVSNSNTLKWSYNTSKLSKGKHIILAKAYDKVGNVGVRSITVYK